MINIKKYYLRLNKTKLNSITTQKEIVLRMLMDSLHSDKI